MNELRIPVNAVPGPFRRSLGGRDSLEMMGGGFMHKKGQGPDGCSNRYYTLVYVIRGSGTYTDATGRCHRVGAGSAFERIPGYTHSNSIDHGSDWWECFIDLGPLLAGALIAMHFIDPLQSVHTVGASQSLVERFQKFFLDLQSVPSAHLSTMLPQILALRHDVLAGSSTSSPSNEPDLIDGVCALLGDNSCVTFNLEQECRNRGWGYESVRKLFRQRMGISPGHYRIRCRIDKACQLLQAQPSRPVGDIALHLGYCNPYEFSAQFKTYTGLTPRQFRQSGFIR